MVAAALDSTPRRSAPAIRGLVLLAAVLLPVRASAQRGEIAGRVVDAAGATGLDGAVVRLLNTSLATLSAGQGSFRLTGVPVGSHVLIVNRIGFAQRLERVEVRAGETVNLTVQLTPASLRLDELVVSAEKREENVQDLPYAVAVITAAQIEEKRIQSPSDLSGLVPNLMHVNTGSSGFNLVSIRGINSATGNGQENAVAQYVDGVYQFDAANTNFQFLDVDRIEVLRGPQGTLYGRGAMGGVINIVTRQPTNQRGGNVSVDVGNRGLQRYRLSYAVPLAADKLFLNAGALHYRHGGFFDNDFTSDRFDGRNTIAGALKLKLVPSSRWSLDLDLKAERDRDRGVYPWAASDTAAIARPYRVDVNLPNEERRTFGNGSLTLKHFGAVDLVSTSGYQVHHRQTGSEGIDVDFSPLQLVAQRFGLPGPAARGYRNDAFIQEVRLSSSRASTSPVSWLTGAFFSSQKNPSDADVFLAAPVSPFQVDANVISLNDRKATSAALFGQLGYRFSRQVELSVGLRYEHQKTTGSAQNQFLVPGLPPTTTPAAEAEQSSGAVTYRANLSFTPSSQVTVYGTYARGFRPGGFNLAAPTQNLLTFEPEYTDNLEAGLKTTTRDGRLRAYLSAFYIKWSDQQVSALDFTTFTGAIVNTGKATSKGLELELSALPAPRLLADLNLGYTHATYDDLDLSLDPSLPHDLRGNRQPLTPRITATTAVQYRIPLGGAAGRELLLRGEWRHFGRQFFDLENKIAQPAYSLFGASLGVRVGDFDLSVWGANLSDELYIRYGQALGGSRVLLGDPRTFGVSVATRLP
jgi:iron complex outermembrane receptor protein